MKTIDIMSVNEFLGHEPRICEVCEHRQAEVFMIVRDEKLTAKAHVCLTCFELAENSGFDDIIQTASVPDYLETAETWELLNS